MRTVRDADGDRYLLLSESADASRVRDPVTGTEEYRPNDELELVEGESPLTTAARAVPEARRRLLTAVRDERSVGLLVDLRRRGPLDVHELLDAYDLCESDLHGVLAEFRAAGLVEETDVHGRRGYRVTEDGRAALDHLLD